MKPLAESAQNIVSSAKQQTATQKTSSDGSKNGDGKTITQHHQKETEMQNQHITNDSKPQGIVEPKNTWQTGKQETLARTTQLRSLISQSFDIFNIYGKTPEASENIVSGFSVTLEHSSIHDITDAFKEWMRDESTMPTPSDIYKLISQYESDRRWEKNRTGPGKAAPRVDKISTAEWHGLTWNQINEKGFLPQIEKHLIMLTGLHGKQKAAEYLLYLKGLV